MALDLFSRLNQEWSRTVTARSAARLVQSWGTTEDALHGLGDPGAAVDAAHGDDRERADAVLAALIRLGQAEPLAQRIVLQAVIPGLLTTARRFIPGPVPIDEIDATVIAIAWGRIAEYPLERRPRAIAANIVLDTRQRSSAQLFRHARVEVPSADLAEPRLPGLIREDPAAALARVLQEAVRVGLLSEHDARLVALTRIHDVPIADLAAERGVLPHSLRRRRLRIEAALIASAA